MMEDRLKKAIASSYNVSENDVDINEWHYDDEGFLQVNASIKCRIPIDIINVSFKKDSDHPRCIK